MGNLMCPSNVHTYASNLKYHSRNSSQHAERPTLKILCAGVTLDRPLGRSVSHAASRALVTSGDFKPSTSRIQPRAVPREEYVERREQEQGKGYV